MLDHSFPTCAFLFLFEVEISSHTLNLLLYARRLSKLRQLWLNVPRHEHFLDKNMSLQMLHHLTALYSASVTQTCQHADCSTLQLCTLHYFMTQTSSHADCSTLQLCTLHYFMTQTSSPSLIHTRSNQEAGQLQLVFIHSDQHTHHY